GRQLEPRLFVFDPVARMKASDRNENEQTAMSPIIEFWRELWQETGAAVALVNHMGHQGGNIRGTSDMETAWETRRQWSKTTSEVTIRSEHRDAEGLEFKYRIEWDGRTRSMRFEAVRMPLETWLRKYFSEHPEASGNDAYDAAQGRSDRPRKTTFLDLVKRVLEGGSQIGNHPGTTPSD